jgi:hypothetical protein
VNNIQVEGGSNQDGTSSSPASKWTRTRAESTPPRRKPPKLRIGNGKASSSKPESSGSQLNAKDSESLLA